MAGNTTLGENYAFGGMYHIFDQHATAGKKTNEYKTNNDISHDAILTNTRH